MLLMGLRNRNDDRIWTEFCARYQPLLVAFGQRLGLVLQDAQDAAQETLLAFVNAYREGKYDRQKGRLRTWLSGIARHKIRDIRRRRAREPGLAYGGAGQIDVGEIADEGVNEIWEAEWKRAIANACMEQVRNQFEPTTIRAFELFVLNDWPADEVASVLGTSRNAVFLAKRRVLSRMREIHAQLEENW
jgi:RNA polymerase sigma-70 factor (ECF subfamily)